MTTQLRLLEGGARRDWKLDASTRTAGRSGVAAARRALETARRPEPVKLSKAG